MQWIKENETQNPTRGIKISGDNTEIKPMHPEDFRAHLAWVTAKRSQELVRQEMVTEKPVYYRFIGSCRPIP
jgi:hypothetical protein